jgi:hypothetical protein
VADRRQNLIQINIAIAWLLPKRLGGSVNHLMAAE